MLVDLGSGYKDESSTSLWFKMLLCYLSLTTSWLSFPRADAFLALNFSDSSSCAFYSASCIVRSSISSHALLHRQP